MLTTIGHKKALPWFECQGKAFGKQFVVAYSMVLFTCVEAVEQAITTRTRKGIGATAC